MTARDPWRTRAARKLQAQVIREEPTCRLRLDGCTGVSTTADHILTRASRPDLVLVRSNLQGACAHCNYKRGQLPISHVATPPALGFFE